jgi:hypothetical protein
MVFNIGSVEIHGEHIGEKVDFLELECINIILLLKAIVLGELFNLKLIGLLLIVKTKKLKLFKCEPNYLYDRYIFESSFI